MPFGTDDVMLLMHAWFCGELRLAYSLVSFSPGSAPGMMFFSGAFS